MSQSQSYSRILAIFYHNSGQSFWGNSSPSQTRGSTCPPLRRKSSLEEKTLAPLAGRQPSMGDMRGAPRGLLRAHGVAVPQRQHLGTSGTSGTRNAGRRSSKFSTLHRTITIYNNRDTNTIKYRISHYKLDNHIMDYAVLCHNSHMADSHWGQVVKVWTKNIKKNIKPFRSFTQCGLDMGSYQSYHPMVPWSHHPIPIPTALRGGWTRTWAASVKRAGSVRAVSTRVWAV